MTHPKPAVANFKLARKHYNIAKSLIEELSALVQAEQADFLFEEAMRKFDLILQSTLLRTAVEDGCFISEEQQFIENLTDYADLMTFLSHNTDIEVSWDSFSSLDNEKQKDLALDIFVILDDLVNDFMLPFASIAATLPKDYCEEITTAMTKISACLAGCDGDDIDSENFRNETIIAFTLIKKSIKEKWVRIANKAKCTQQAICDHYQGKAPQELISSKDGVIERKYLKKECP